MRSLAACAWRCVAFALCVRGVLSGSVSCCVVRESGCGGLARVGRGWVRLWTSGEVGECERGARVARVWLQMCYGVSGTELGYPATDVLRGV
eukprot:872529-Rhodomonas_salina.1